VSIDETPPGKDCSRSEDAAGFPLTEAVLEGLTVAEVRQLSDRIPEGDESSWAILERDRRVGVRKLAVQHRRALERRAVERARQERLLTFERRFWSQGIMRVAGVDEAGRGCLAGPVVAAAVILPSEVDIPGLDDSKKLSPQKRERLLEEIRGVAVGIGIGRVEAEEIDRINILQAALKGMRLALDQLGVEPQQVLIDGNRKPQSRFPEIAVIDGDALSLSIAAASVVAKVHRDHLMIEYDARFPEYRFAKHKGYGSAAHLLALQTHGPCPLHRRSFGPVAELVRNERSELFQTFCEGLEACRNPEELERLGQFIKEGAAELGNRDLEELRRRFRRCRERLLDVGRRGEQAAADFLTDRGYAILERGYRGAGGEIDLIVRRGEELAFVEVKTSRQGSTGHPEERVGAAKRAHLIRVAHQYLGQQGEVGSTCRFDVIAVMLGCGEPEIHHLEDAFQA
jgi:ribonuclease HII